MDKRAISWHSRYTFSAKEKDEESSYSYFGARYYDSELSIWLSVDPQSASHPMTNNYMYCLGNPLRLVDPNGETEWEVNTMGYIRKVEGTDNKPDKLFVVGGTKKGEFNERAKDSKGNLKSVDVDANIMNSISEGITPYNNKDANGNIVKGMTDYTNLDASGNIENARDIFTFMSKNVGAEWFHFYLHFITQK